MRLKRRQRQNIGPLRRSKRLRRTSSSSRIDSESDSQSIRAADVLVDPESDSQSTDSAELVASDSEGEECELHVYENRYDNRGEQVSLRVGTKSDFGIVKDRSHKAGLVVVRQYSRSKNLKYTDLEIRSPYVRKALREVIHSYPGITMSSIGRILIRDQPRCLFHFYNELESYADASNDPLMRKHVHFCLKYAENALRREINLYEITVGNTRTEPGLEHRDLWMVFKPGVLLYQKIKGREVLFRFKSLEESEVDQEPKYLTICMQKVGCDGESFAYCDYGTVIPYYDGWKPFVQLPIFPLHYHSEEQRIRKDLIIRGKKYISLLGIHYCLHHETVSSSEVKVTQRVMIDSEEYQRIQKRKKHPSKSIITLEAINGDSTLPEEDLLICGHTMPGYSFKTGRWALFEVTEVQNVEFNAKAFSNLVMPSENKELIYSLVNSYSRCDTRFDDFIEGKGKGLIFLLHGPPGVGKTFTAESIADYTHCPLLTVGSGKLIGPGFYVEGELTEVFDLAKRWKALVLIDEADVFMQQRSFQELDRNALVSVLLRKLEYFEGIIFLTTNRVATLDEAFKSRIHLSISYPTLSYESKKDIWRSLIHKGNHSDRFHWLNDNLLAELAKTNGNGREIKNVVRMASALAQNDNREMKASDLLRSVAALESFGNDPGREVTQQKQSRADMDRTEQVHKLEWWKRAERIFTKKMFKRK